ncbi:hypothetical protein [Actinoalloteichus caeruleus]|uniref:Uncharacterized protein n=1 Tax=Actinoalloteichus caeruleus DSM 43889 TaxID=1120930 RepID=A0ABT1JD89_ACTCY|nr:hypothetical protein [Actinoalloteichus caeruleus]MCP2329756.1 hypothetical protein [Actinoalloteichus caeruleus DSM 43889]
MHSQEPTTSPSALEALARLPDDEAYGELTGLARAALQRARALGLTVVDELPEGGGWTVRLPDESYDATRVVELAAGLDTGLLYVSMWAFDPDDVEEFGPASPPADDGVAAVQRVMRRFDGVLYQFDVAFVHRGVLHRWTYQEPFYALFRQALAAVSPAAPTARHEGTGDVVDSEEVRRLAAVLLALPAFRAAGTDVRRARVARRQPELRGMLSQSGLPGRTAREAIQQATDTALQVAEDHHERLARSLPTLAEELADDPRFQEAGNATLRRKVADDFLVERADGYRCPVWLREKLLTTAPLNGGGARRPS